MLRRVLRRRKSALAGAVILTVIALAALPLIRFVTRGAAPPKPATAVAAPAGTAPPRPASPAAGRPANPFLSQDPALKARRLARALISDMVVYHPGKRQEGLRDGNLKELFEEEIKKDLEQGGIEITAGIPGENAAGKK